MKPKISVIVPVYKVEKYLGKCIESILTQTFADFELLLIDDGSPDKSGEICDEYAQKDERIKVFHKQNSGVSSARNLGLDNVKGEWICFVDADDYLDSGAFSFLADKTENSKVDIVCFNNYFTDHHGEITTVEPVAHEERVSVVDNINEMLLYKIHRAPWGKFYKQDIISNLRFNESIHVAEDLLFHITILLNKSNTDILSCTEYIYYYRIWDGSAMVRASHDYELLNKEIKQVLETGYDFNSFKEEYSIFVFLNLFLLIIRKNKGYLNRNDYKSSIHLIKEAYRAKHKMQLRHKLAVVSYLLHRRLGNAYSRFFTLVKSMS